MPLQKGVNIINSLIYYSGTQFFVNVPQKIKNDCLILLSNEKLNQNCMKAFNWILVSKGSRIAKQKSMARAAPLPCGYLIAFGNRNVFFDAGNRFISRTHNAFAGCDLLNAVRAPAGYSRDCEKRSIKLGREAEDFIDHA